MEGSIQQHFLILTYPAQGHINPAIHLANRLAKTVGARITFSTAISAHHKMFPNITPRDQEVVEGLITYRPFSDGYDEGFARKVDDVSSFFSQFKSTGSLSIASLIDNLNSSGRNVDCVLYTFMLPWVAEIARTRGISSAQYWIQPATVFAIYYYAFLHDYEKLIAEKCNDPLSVVEFPGMPPLQIRDLPSFLTQSSSSDDQVSKELLAVFREALHTSYKEKLITQQNSKVLVNSFDELETNALTIVKDVDLIAVGPVLQSFPKDDSNATSSFDLFKPDEKEYKEWLDSKPKNSVVYVSFGSLFVLKKEQVLEILKGLKASGRPYLWVLREDSRYDDVELEVNGDNAMVVQWCSQVNVLNHPSVGCFVTHCGWNSTLESLVCGVPTVAMPQWTDQGTNAMLIEKVWGTGVRGEANNDGVLEGEELRRCLDLVLGENENGTAIRKNATMWKEKAVEAVSDGGSSDRNLKAFVNDISK